MFPGATNGAAMDRVLSEDFDGVIFRIHTHSVTRLILRN
jgi:hypothetical protein